MNDDDAWISDVADFDLERSTDAAWAGFAERLAEVLSVMDEGASLSIGSLGGDDVHPPFVTFTCGEQGRLRARAAGRDSLAPARTLDDGQLATMAALGWTATGPPGTDLACEGSQEEPLPLAADAVAALRTVYGVEHPAFLAPDQLAEILTPATRESPTGPIEDAAPADPPVVYQPRDRDELDALLAATLQRDLGHPPLRDSEGDLAFRAGSTMVFVRPSPDAEEVIVFAPVVHDVEGRSRAMEVISDINTEARYVRFLLIRDRVYVSLSLFAQPFVPAHLAKAVGMISVIGDRIDEELAAKLRGRTTFSDEDDDL
ncbi:T3SS (YopN, CesT) and YbjN peptide-binding chaperone 1 [Nigerium massiliense]|uniref:T3SS (YopN, CesT) and YbjN peptide-binding chaperone 1 n=1 Tax=Nigerium massiliense TaxID=1522317 RepID=UPI000694C720|nr:hypothetical protein [Nigerium massiliense]